MGQITHWAYQALQTQWGKSPDLPGANSLVSVGVFVLNFKVLKKRSKQEEETWVWSMCEYL